MAIVDLHLPKEIDGSESVQNGKDLLANLMKNYPNLHLVVLTGRRRESLVTLKNEIDNHQGGFVIASKDCSELDLKEYIDSTQRRYKLTQIIREGIELTPEEYKVLKLMSEGKMNVQIAKAMFIDDKKVGRTITSIYGKLGVPTESNARLFAINRAREIGLLD